MTNEEIKDPDETAAYLVAPAGHKITSLRAVIDEFRAVPVRHKGTSRHETVDSLVAHANNWKTFGFDPKGAVVFASLKPAQIVVVYDYDRRYVDWRDHRAVYEFPQSRDFARWLNVFGKTLGNEALADLLEDRLADVVAPEIALASGVTVPTGMRLATPAELLTLSNGTADLSFEESHAVQDSKGTTITVPNGFVLALEPFVDGDRFAVPVRLRYKLNNNVIGWTLTPHNIDNAVRDAVRRECKRFAEATGLKLVWGTAETPATVR